MDKEIAQDIAQGKETYYRQDGKKFSVLCLGGIKWVAHTREASIREVETVALEQDVIPPRYFRNIGTIGRVGQIKLLRSSVAVVGVGGLGGVVIEFLARYGIGRLIIIDYDRFTETDLNRQLMATEENLGDYKVAIAARRVSEINSAIEVTTHRDQLTKDNVRDLLKGAHIVVDCLDNLPSRFIVEDACRDLGIPFVHGAVAGFSGQLMTVFPEDGGLSSVYGARGLVPVRGTEVEIGIPSAIPAMIAAWQVQEVIKIITGIGKPLRNRLLILDAAEGVVEEIQVGR